MSQARKVSPSDAGPRSLPGAAAVKALRRARQQLSGYLLRHGRVRKGKNWTLAHRRWLATLRFEQPAQQIVLEALMGQLIENGTEDMASCRNWNVFYNGCKKEKMYGL